MMYSLMRPKRAQPSLRPKSANCSRKTRAWTLSSKNIKIRYHCHHHRHHGVIVTHTVLFVTSGECTQWGHQRKRWQTRHPPNHAHCKRKCFGWWAHYITIIIAHYHRDTHCLPSSTGLFFIVTLLMIFTESTQQVESLNRTINDLQSEAQSKSSDTTAIQELKDENDKLRTTIDDACSHHITITITITSPSPSLSIIGNQLVTERTGDGIKPRKCQIGQPKTRGTNRRISTANFPRKTTSWWRKEATPRPSMSAAITADTIITITSWWPSPQVPSLWSSSLQWAWPSPHGHDHHSSNAVITLIMLILMCGAGCCCERFCGRKRRSNRRPQTTTRRKRKSLDRFSSPMPQSPSAHTVTITTPSSLSSMAWALTPSPSSASDVTQVVFIIARTYANFSSINRECTTNRSFEQHHWRNSQPEHDKRKRCDDETHTRKPTTQKHNRTSNHLPQSHNYQFLRPINSAPSHHHHTITASPSLMLSYVLMWTPQNARQHSADSTAHDDEVQQMQQQLSQAKQQANDNINKLQEQVIIKAFPSPLQLITLSLLSLWLTPISDHIIERHSERKNYTTEHPQQHTRNKTDCLGW